MSHSSSWAEEPAITLPLLCTLPPQHPIYSNADEKMVWGVTRTSRRRQRPVRLQLPRNLDIISPAPSIEVCGGSMFCEVPIDEDLAVRQIEKSLDRRARRRHDHLALRILRKLITQREELNDESIDSLLLAADKIIFDRKLSGRVGWAWSKPHERQYDQDLLGTTALRAADPRMGGFQTLIILSKPLLQHKQFNRDLLLSAFFHELIHCYLFIRCGIAHAMHSDGHTPGFRKIASLIDKSFGHQRLHLCNMRANLDLFPREERECLSSGESYRGIGHEPRANSPAYVNVQDLIRSNGQAVSEGLQFHDIEAQEGNLGTDHFDLRQAQTRRLPSTLGDF